ncbi:hypothetical protein JI58_07890 [Marinosulfonomonas sp. PRT-SC04]|nr:hypothetical protein JI58_08030 [Marinosulfonomonas sp. PRT-SC04]KPU83689.1 hypothetical protein JI58_07890 [Marinosulfonomonas sp. PRT-SC04]
MAVILPVIIKLLRIQIGLPLGVILVAGLWVTFDKTSAVRHAVNAQADKFVSMVAQDQLAELERRRQVAVDALQIFRTKAHVADAQAAEYAQKIQEYENGTQIHPSCIVGPDLFNRLR